MTGEDVCEILEIGGEKRDVGAREVLEAAVDAVEGIAGVRVG